MIPKKAKASAEELPLHDLCPAGGSGQGEIETATELEEKGVEMKLEGRVWRLTLVTDGQAYGADCILQTEKWKPKKGDLVRFDRQASTIDDHFLHATRLLV